MGSGFLKREPSALLNGLWLPKWEGDPIKEGIYISPIHFSVQQKLNTIL